MTETPPEPSRLTDEQISYALNMVFSYVAQTTERQRTGSLLEPVESGSSLAGDDRATEPYQLSQGVTTAVGVAVEHLDSIRALLLDARVLHPRAPFTIARAAIEAACTGVWLLGPTSRKERALRRLRQVWQDGTDGDQAYAEFVADWPSSERKERMLRIARRATGDPELELTGVGPTSIVRYADQQIESPLTALAAWRVCSGFSHGRMWSVMSVLNRDERESSVPGVVDARITSTLDRILWPVLVTHKVIVKATQLYEQRRVRHY